MNSRQSIVEQVFDFVNLVRKAPRTIHELADLLEVHRNTAERYVDIARGEGLIEPCDVTEPAAPSHGRRPVFYRWADVSAAPRPQPPPQPKTRA